MNLLFDSGMIGSALRTLIAFGAIFGCFVYLLVWAERKVSAWIQGRLGPNRIGPFGLLQGLADGIKFIFKEEIRPANAHKLMYLLAPAIALFPAVLAFAVVPFGAKKIEGVIHPLQIANLNVGILFVLAITSLGVYGIIVG